MPTINFALGSATVNWDGGNTVGSDQHAGLVNQARRNVMGAQEGPPAPDDVINNIVAFEESLSTAQLIVFGVGRLDDDGARGGPEALSHMTRLQGGSISTTRGRTIPIHGARRSRGPGGLQHRRLRRLPRFREQRHEYQEPAVRHRHRVRCGAHAGSAALHIRESHHAGETAADRRGTGQHHRCVERPREVQDADAARPRGARAVFHNGIAPTIESVVRFYEEQLGFVFTDRNAPISWRS